MQKLTVPVTLCATQRNGLVVIGGGKTQMVNFPVEPYSWKETQPGQGIKMNQVGGGEIWIDREFYGSSIPMRARMSYGNNKNDRSFHKNEPVIDYVLNLIKDHPDEVKALSSGEEPYPMFIDIETDSRKGLFSNPERDEILSVQIKFPGEDPYVILQDENTTETDLILTFINLAKMNPRTGLSPDVIVGYFINKFDIPYLRTRAKKCGLTNEWNTMDKIEDQIIYSDWVNPGPEEMAYTAKGLMNIDLYIHAKTDLSLKDLPSRTQKAVAKAYGSSYAIDLLKEEKGNMRELMVNEREKFITYATSDIMDCEFLWNVYAPRLMAASNLLTVPFTLTHRLSSGQKSYIPVYREAKANGYYSLKKNSSRYLDLMARSPKYQGAIVECFQKGYFDKSIYVDAKSMYPNIIYDFNLSYDRYQLMEVIEYEDWNGPTSNSGNFCITAEGSQTEKIIYIPDDKYKAVLKFKCNLVDDGFMRGLISTLNNARDENKKIAKKYEHDETPEGRAMYMMFDSAQAESKIVTNTVYGLQATGNYEIADLPMAIFVTAVGRWIMQQMIDLFGDALIEVDTDGVILDRTKFSLSIEEINDYLKDRLVETFGLPRDKMKFQLEFEGAGSIYMYKQKNYILRLDESEKLKIKGSAFTGYDKAPVILKAVKLMADAVMYQKYNFDDAVTIVTSIDDAPIDDFKFTKVLKKQPYEYKGYKSSMTYVKSVDPTEKIIYKPNKEKEMTEEYERKFTARMGELRKEARARLNRDLRSDEYSSLKSRARGEVEKEIGEKYGMSLLPGDPVPISMMKNRAVRWIEKFLPTTERKDDWIRLVKDCKKESELDIVLTSLDEAYNANVAFESKKNNSRTTGLITSNMLLDIMMDLISRGEIVEEDKVVEYYYANNGKGYILAEDLKDKSEIDIERYRKEVNTIVERFQYANPMEKELSLW